MNTSFISPIPQKKEIISAIKDHVMGYQTLHVFNPEHDLALAVGKGPYTPPAEVKRIRNNLSLLPAIYARNGDFILIQDEIGDSELKHLPFFDIASQKNINIFRTKEIADNALSVCRVLPWGWDHAVIESLSEAGVNPSLMPDKNKLDHIRRLSNRATVIPFREFISNYLNQEIFNPPVMIQSIEEAEKFLMSNPISYFKAPWSSSGHGIVVSDHISHKGLMEWCHGTIKKQGSILAEPSWQRVFDFATEWEVKGGKAFFMGYSVFKTSSRGKYHENITASQEELRNIIRKEAPEFNDRYLQAQEKAIDKLISPYYQGYLGIDLLADNAGKINPCVEINLRLTMGHIPILRNV